MSSSYTANQYENAFKSHRLQSWTIPKDFKERPSAVEGHTGFIATDRGHLLPGVKRGSSWTSFQGTWDLPSRIPPVHINPTARSQEGQERLKTWILSQSLVQSATDNKYNKEDVGSRASSRTSLNKNASVNQLHEEQQDPVSSPAPDPGQEPVPEKPLTPHSNVQSRPATQQSHAESRPASKQNKAESRPTSQQHHVGSRPQSQASQAQSRPASQTSRTG
ncbi:protein Flattop [Astyanax mexicanus]|uniref:Protein Flattop n=1 Tax=Astyanax mexicanus TaxID=7994 RepID=A0A8B9LI98_ASTMX|nr:protein Flattop [Astyanax mexicanus]